MIRKVFADINKNNFPIIHSQFLTFNQNTIYGVKNIGWIVIASPPKQSLTFDPCIRLPLNVTK